MGAGAKGIPGPIASLVNILKERQDEFIAKGFAMMTYRPSIGRVLDEGSIDRFVEIAWRETRKLQQVASIEEFDRFHDSFVERLLGAFKTNKGEKLSYGQAQKPVNVFLKVYVAQANLPDSRLAAKLKPFLHIPLDSIIMKYFRKEFPAEYNTFLSPVLAEYREFAQQRGFRYKVGDRWFLNIANIYTQAHYYAWQSLFRNLYPECPVLLDSVWSLERRKKPSDQLA